MITLEVLIPSPHFLWNVEYRVPFRALEREPDFLTTSLKGDLL